jgi:hypothetical protein
MKHGHRRSINLEYWWVEDSRLASYHGPNNPIRDWCDHTFTERNDWSIMYETILFSNEQDYMLYILTWFDS